MYDDLPMKSFADLKTWQEGMDLVAEVYRLTALLPRSEQFGLSSQLKRASTSIVANIAEGFGRYSYADKAHKYVIARGECTEVVAFLLVATRVKLLKQSDVQSALATAEVVGKLLSGLIQSARKRSPTP